MNLEKGTTIELEIIDIGTDGQGIGKIDGLTVFVSKDKETPVYGDIVLAEIVENKKRFIKASLKEVMKPSELRSEPHCEYANECGGCALSDMTYAGQLELKEKQVRDKYMRIAGLEAPVVNQIIGMDEPFGYRNKAQIAVGNNNVGFFSSKSHSVIDCKTCNINSKPAEVIAEVVRSFVKTNKITDYDRRTGKGLLRHVIVRTAFKTGEVMVILVVNGKTLPAHEKLIEMMDDAVYAITDANTARETASKNRNPETNDGSVVDDNTGAEAEDGKYSLESVVLNINTEKSSQVLGEKNIILAGKPTILDMAGSFELETAVALEFEISPLAFYQVNSIQMEKLCDKVLEYADLKGHETVLDIYCGIGTIGLWCAKRASKVLGIESNKDAVLNANRNAVINGIVNAQYICGKAEEELPKLINLETNSKWSNFFGADFNADVVILDPPRAGCKPELLNAVAKTNAKRIIYVSCDIATQARDIKILKELGYEFVEATPVDMFPWSMNVESVVLLKSYKSIASGVVVDAK